MNNKVSLISVEITPSNCCKSNKEQSSKYTRLNEALGVDISHDLQSYVRKLSPADALELLNGSEPVVLVTGGEAPVFTYQWVVPKVSMICFTFILSVVTCHRPGSK